MRRRPSGNFGANALVGGIILSLIAAFEVAIIHNDASDKKSEVRQAETENVNQVSQLQSDAAAPGCQPR